MRQTPAALWLRVISGQHKVLGIKLGKTNWKSKAIQSATRAGISLGMRETTEEGLKVLQTVT